MCDWIDLCGKDTLKGFTKEVWHPFDVLGKGFFLDLNKKGSIFCFDNEDLRYHAHFCSDPIVVKGPRKPWTTSDLQHLDIPVEVALWDGSDYEGIKITNTLTKKTILYAGTAELKHHSSQYVCDWNPD